MNDDVSETIKKAECIIFDGNAVDDDVLGNSFVVEKENGTTINQYFFMAFLASDSMLVNHKSKCFNMLITSHSY